MQGQSTSEGLSAAAGANGVLSAGGAATGPAEPASTSGSRRTSQSLERGLFLIDLVAAAPEGMTVTELAAEIGVHRTIITRMLRTLTAKGWVSKDSDGRYGLGLHAVEIGRLVLPRLRFVALPALRRLAEEINATTHLTVMEGDEAVALAVEEPRNTTFHVTYRTGSRRPLTRGSSGRAILAALPPRDGEDTSIDLVRRRGWAITTGEIEDGVTGIAAAIPHPQYTGCSIGAVMVGTVHEPEQIAEAVMATAASIAASI
ncbi:IclR family transcriptional regulator [Rhodococcus sp. T2V]|uniref:IclR family transcriptional regulator n=1 Tax=Rhodococcus sp. T2V TaxID=3034164 RepID=UPI0023E0A049|nr:IclR family transcriptional regulator [Rhodococcus sp. T2V]MDF3313175.1 IclR family transcriptional regulator [Rhodococcus sp. T2V]